MSILNFPSKINGIVIPKSAGGKNFITTTDNVGKINLDDLECDSYKLPHLKRYLLKEGFRIQSASKYAVHISGSHELYNQVFKLELCIQQHTVQKKLGEYKEAEFIEVKKQHSGDKSWSEIPKEAKISKYAEGILFELPHYFTSAEPSALAPGRSHWHLRVPNDLQIALNAARCHRLGISGRGVKVAMIDSGFYRHEFYKANGFRAHISSKSDVVDEIGHGTGEAANLFSIAPDITLIPIKMEQASASAAFSQAIESKPDIISCSWAFNIPDKLYGPQRLLDAQIIDAVSRGIVVIAAAGNGEFGFPAQHPQVISVGGVYQSADGSLSASPFASGFKSKIYPARLVPDVCGLVGLSETDSYLYLPVPPGSEFDREFSPPADEAGSINDGWAAFSGTSAATPQIAGVCALMKQVAPNLRPHEFLDILIQSSIDVSTGRSNPKTGGHAAKIGHDLATGAGLPSAYNAVLEAASRYGKAL